MSDLWCPYCSNKMHNGPLMWGIKQISNQVVCKNCGARGPEVIAPREPGSPYYIDDTRREQLKKAEEARKDATEAWKELALVIKGELSRSDCECQLNIDLLRPTPTEEYINRLFLPKEVVEPYGFISPDGEFHEVDWAMHESFAGDYIREHEGWEAVLKSDKHTGTDYLVLVKGWLLLHNPRQGKPFLTSGDKPMTKAQREALFDYYTKYGMKQEANALYEEDE